jgi:hypothetical protein
MCIMDYITLAYTLLYVEEGDHIIRLALRLVHECPVEPAAIPHSTQSAYNALCVEGQRSLDNYNNRFERGDIIS